MGTSFSVVVVNPAAEFPHHEIRVQLVNRLDQINDVASTYRASSELSRFNLHSSTDWVDTSIEFCLMISEAYDVSRVSGGAFDFTVGLLVNLWGFGPDAMTGDRPQDDDIAAAARAVGFQNVEFDCDNTRIRKLIPRLEIDLSGWAKGYAVDQIAELLDAAGQENFLVEIGGEIRASGTNAESKPFAIALESQTFESMSGLPIIKLHNTGVATSGTYRNFFEFDDIRYSHILDPRSGQPVKHALSAVTVIHNSVAYADAVATALLVLGPDSGPALANELGIAAYFAVSAADGLQYISSDAFSQGQFLSGQVGL